MIEELKWVKSEKNKTVNCLKKEINAQTKNDDGNIE